MRKMLDKNKTVHLPEVSKVPELRCSFPASHQGDGQLGRDGGARSSCAPPALPLTHSPPGKVLGSPVCFSIREMVLIGFLTVCIYFKG